MRNSSFVSRVLGILVPAVIVFSALVTFGDTEVSSDMHPVITVSKDGEGDYSSIREAIENASDGYRIQVGEGIYDETIVVNRQITLIGSGNGTTIIDGGGNGDVVTIENDDVNMSGFTVRGSGAEGAGIAIHSNDTVIRNNSCTNNTFGIWVNGTGNMVDHNDCLSNSGTGIHVASSSGSGITSIVNNLCLRNKNFGIHVLLSENVIVSANTCNFSAYGIYIRNSDMMVINDNTCDHNYDRGIFLSGGEYNNVMRNTCSKNVNGILISYSNRNNVYMNTCPGNQKGIVLSNGNANTLTNNECLGNLDGIHLETTEQNIVNKNNCSGNSGSGIHLSEDASRNRLEFNSIYNNTERGVYIRSSSSHNVMTNNTISGNRFGIRVVQYSGNNSALYNNILGNSEYGIFVASEDCAVNASNSWWGNASGPYHELENQGGGGDNVTDHVHFTPWSCECINQPPTAHIMSPENDRQGISEGDEIMFEGRGEDNDHISRYAWRSSIDGEIYNGSDTIFTTAKLSPGEHVIYFYVQDDCGAWSPEVSVSLTVEEEDDGRGMVVILIVVIILVFAIVGVLTKTGKIQLVR